jgi:hypothetical protein
MEENLFLPLAAGAEKGASLSQAEALYFPPTAAARKRLATINFEKILKTPHLSLAVSIISDGRASCSNSLF